MLRMPLDSNCEWIIGFFDCLYHTTIIASCHLQTCGKAIDGLGMQRVDTH